MEKSKNSLYVGGDDSNHAGTSKGEIIVAVFSEFLDDSRERIFPAYRDFDMMSEWLSDERRDFRFSLLTHSKYRYKSDNLPKKIPFLVSSYLEEKNLQIDYLKLCLDGRVSREDKQEIKEELRSVFGIERVIVANYLKKRKNKKRRVPLPPLIYYSDCLANFLFSHKTLEELSLHEKMVPLSNHQTLMR